MKFTELNIQAELLTAIEKMGFEEMTPVQEQTIPLALKGEDLIGQAQTGTGKTAAFGIPMLEQIDITNPDIQALVVAPTRELAIQTQEETFQLGRDKKVKVQSVYGGADIRPQIKRLSKNPQVIVGTPGRLMDHMKRRTIVVDNLKVLVLDEADEMLNMGFIDDIRKIISKTPEERQTLLFSATMPKAIQNIANQFMKEPETIRIKAKTLSSKNVEQYYTRVKDFEKFDTLTRFIDTQTPELAIVFARTKRRVDEVSRALTQRGYSAEAIHGDIAQHQRMKTLNRFKEGKFEILVATDVAARGLDVENLTHVYNYDLPQDPESYVHRIGRTGRAGAKGTSMTFVTPNEMKHLKSIERLTKQTIKPMLPPTDEEAMEGYLEAAENEIESIISKIDVNKHQESIQTLVENYSAEKLAAALLKVLVKDPEEVSVDITPQRSQSGRGRGGHKGGGGRNRKSGGRRHNNKGRRNNNRGGKR